MVWLWSDNGRLLRSFAFTLKISHGPVQIGLEKLVKLGIGDMAYLAYLAYTESMAMDMMDNKELTVTEARDSFSQLVNRAAFGGEVTFIHRGRNHETVAAIVPADLVEKYEAFLDQEDGRIAMERLADLEAGREKLIPAEEIERKYGL